MSQLRTGARRVSTPGCGQSKAVRTRVAIAYRASSAMPKSCRWIRNSINCAAHVDLLPTLARLCSLDTQPVSKLDGQDLVDYINGEKLGRASAGRAVAPRRRTGPVAEECRDERSLATGGRCGTVRHPSRSAQQHPLGGPEYQETVDQLRQLTKSGGARSPSIPTNTRRSCWVILKPNKCV